MKVKVIRYWDWVGIPQVELEFDDGTRDSINTSIFDGRIADGTYEEVNEHEKGRGPMNKPEAEAIAGGNRWRVVVELTFDVEPEDCETKYRGDALVDFQSRAFQRVRPAIQGLAGPDKPFAHFHVLEQAKGCTEFD